MSHKFGPDKEKRIIPVVKLDDPGISDPSAERLGPIETVVEATRVTKQRTIATIPQEEIDNKTELNAIKAVAQDLKNGAGTATKRLERVERVLFRMLKDQYGN